MVHLLPNRFTNNVYIWCAHNSGVLHVGVGRRKKGKGFDSRGAKALRWYGRIISKPFFFVTKVDEKLNTHGKRYCQVK